ncbi:protein translocase subunit SecD [Hahella sp. SMD15-11]|uniref:Protein translocase subunit SecD n=1 Tax=Thermohahella caldifontis TaxID=3142973 RepID=A0AB39UZ73_9GAMM
MLNHYPWWKNLLILLVLALSTLYAIPNLYPDDYAVQISGASATTAVDESVLNKATSALDKAGVPYRDPELADRRVTLRFDSNEDQLAAKPVLTRALGDDFVVALNLVPTTPDWLKAIGAKPMKLGLDLRGGVHFLLEVDMDKAVAQRLDMFQSRIKSRLREEKLRYREVIRDQGATLIVTLRRAGDRDKAAGILRREMPEFLIETTEHEGLPALRLTLTPAQLREIEDNAITQNLTTLRNRVNELGVAEPLVQRQGRNRIVVELPGVQDTAAAKRVIGATANLEFRLEAKPDAPASETETYPFRSNPARTAILEKDVIITGESVVRASQGFDQNGQPQVNISLDSEGGRMMNRVTRHAIKRRMAVLFVEHKERTVGYEKKDGKEVPVKERYVEKQIISLATIQSALGSDFRITGLDSVYEAQELALLLRAGALAAPIYFVEERTVGPSLGQQNIESGKWSIIIGFSLVLLFMLVYYRVFGLVANVALAANVVMLIACMSIFGATLTLPGMAGIVLTVGMAVDANVLIYERIREEWRNGLPPQSAIHAGYDRAFISIFDANITTLIAALILFAVGTGPVRGFAITLSIGIITSMFTSITVSRALVNLIYGGRKIKTLSIGGKTGALAV